MAPIFPFKFDFFLKSLDFACGFFQLFIKFLSELFSILSNSHLSELMPEFPPRPFPARANIPPSQTAPVGPKPVDNAQSPARIRERAFNPAAPLSTVELAKAQAAERALARAKEYDRINATDKDDWYYIQGDQQLGPVPLDDLKAIIVDLSTDPPIELAWHEGMKEWKPVCEIALICGVSPLAATQAFKLPVPARRPGDGM